MISRRAKRQLFDRFHRGFVYTMISITVVSLGCVGVSMFGLIQDVKKKERLMLAELQSKDDPEEFPSPTSPVPIR